MKIVWLVTIVQILVTASCPPAWAGEADGLVLPKMLIGNGNEVCAAAMNIIPAMKNEDFWVGRWREHFDSVEWTNGSYLTVTAEGRRAYVPFKYITIDANNDGHQDVVVIYTGLLSSIDRDWLYLFDPEQFRAAQRKGTINELFQVGPSLIDRTNVMRFSDGQYGLPVELHLWRYKGMNYVLAKEHYFAKEETNAPDSFFVAQLRRKSTKSVDVSKEHLLLPDLTCRIVAQ